MHVRLLAAASLVAALGVAVVPAQATPYAGQYRYLSSGPLAVQGADGARWLLQIGATQSGSYESRAEQRLYVDLTRCAGTCTEVGRWSRPLTDAEIAISPFGATAYVVSGTLTARLRTVLGGFNLDVTLSDTGTGGAVDGLGISTTPPGIGPGVEQYSYAEGNAHLGALSCRIARSEGSFGEVTGADTLGDDARDPRTAPPAALPAGFLKGKRAAHC